uniref:AB hydrolase-1 domain-containing protein n=1 Tax=Pseudo-nitzschia australis TaxID=44445 RepID=A0A7S4AUK2_9STRA
MEILLQERLISFTRAACCYCILVYQTKSDKADKTHATIMVIPLSASFHPTIRGRYHLHKRCLKEAVFRQRQAGYRHVHLEGGFKVVSSSSLASSRAFVLSNHAQRSFETATTTNTNNNNYNNNNNNSSDVSRKIVSAPNGIDFRVTVRNPDAPYPCLCLPGALGTGSSDFSNLLYDKDGGLGPEFGIYAFDPRGLGGSVNYNYNSNSGSKDDATENHPAATVQRDYPIGFYVRDALDAAQVMKTLGFDRYSVLGWSDGANSAIHLAAHPDTKESVRNLVVWGGGAYVTKDDVDAWESLRDIHQWSPRMRQEKAAVHGGSMEYLQQLNDAATDGWIQLYHNPQTNGDVCLSALHQVDCPTSVLHGSKDVICATKHAQYISRQIPKATLTIFPDGKHNIHQRYATDFHRLVRKFLTETMDDEASAAAAAVQPFISTVVTSQKEDVPLI